MKSHCRRTFEAQFVKDNPGMSLDGPTALSEYLIFRAGYVAATSHALEIVHNAPETLVDRVCAKVDGAN